MQTALAIALIVAGMSLVASGVFVLLWVEHPEEERYEPHNGADGSYMGYVVSHLLDRNAEGYEE